MTGLRSEVADGMRIDWDVPVPMDDGVVLRADVFRPAATGAYPVILSYGPYGKWLHFEDLYTDQWRRMLEEHPDVTAGSSNKYQNWEVVDPDKWVPDGYACVRVDSRGAGRSPGRLDLWSARETWDLYHCIEWAGAQPWSSGRIGLNGISYYAMTWTKLYLDPADHSLVAEPPTRDGHVTYGGFGDGVTFLTRPLEAVTEVTGPAAAKLHVSSETTDADLFLVLRVFTPDLREVTFQGALDPRTPVAQGWLRASHRRLDSTLTLPYRPYHTHDARQPLTPGQVYELDVEIWPTCIVVPVGYRIGLTVRGRDYEYPGGPGAGLGVLGPVFTGVGPFRHDDERDRPPEVFGKRVTVHCGPTWLSHVLLPIVPPKE